MALESYFRPTLPSWILVIHMHALFIPFRKVIMPLVQWIYAHPRHVFSSPLFVTPIISSRAPLVTDRFRFVAELPGAADRRIGAATADGGAPDVSTRHEAGAGAEAAGRAESSPRTLRCLPTLCPLSRRCCCCCTQRQPRASALHPCALAARLHRLHTTRVRLQPVS